MKILIYLNTNIFLPHVIDCFKSLNFDITFFEIKCTSTFMDTDFMKKLSDALLKDKYDLVFTSNYSPIISMTCNIHNVRYASWVVDSPCGRLNSPTIANKCNYIFIFDKDSYNYYHSISPNTIFYMPLGANTSAINNINLTDFEYKKYNSDISFIGRLYKNFLTYDNITFEPYWQGYFDSLLNIQVNLYGYSIFQDAIDKNAINAFCRAANLRSPEKRIKNDIIDTTNVKDLIIKHHLEPACTRMERIKIIDILSKKFTFNLYTDETDTPSYITNKGIAEPTVEAFKIYKASKINLNMTSKSITSGVPLRVFDILGSKGFLITNYQPEIPDMYEPGKDLIIYENSDDLVQKITYYLDHEDERLEIAENGYKKTVACHDYTKRILEMLKIIFIHPS